MGSEPGQGGGGGGDSAGDTGSPGPLFCGPGHRDGGENMPGARKPSPHPSPTKHTPPPLLLPGTLERGLVGFLHSGIEGGIFHSKT